MRVAEVEVNPSGAAAAAPAMSRAAASRMNGSRSRGPRTVEGKAASSRNALKHGLTARHVLLPGEDPAEFEGFAADLCVELQPAGTLQRTLVIRVAELAWKLRRLPVVEGAILKTSQEQDLDGTSPGGLGDLLHQMIGKESDGILMRLQRYETRLERSLQACLRELRTLQDRAADERSSGKTRSSAEADSALGTPREWFLGSFGAEARTDAPQNDEPRNAIAGESVAPSNESTDSAPPGSIRNDARPDANQDSNPGAASCAEARSDVALSNDASGSFCTGASTPENASSETSELRNCNVSEGADPAHPDSLRGSAA